MQFDVTFFALAIPAVLFAGISKGGFGSGAAFAATPFLALILEPQVAVGLMLPLLMLMDIGALKPYWRKWDGPASILLIGGAIPGILLGAVFYSLADPDLFRLLIGLIAVGFVVYQLLKARGVIAANVQPIGRTGGVIAGVAAGFTSFISHAGGPPAAIFLLSKGVSKTAYQATTVIVFWAINLAKFIPYAFLGFFTVETFKANLYLAPFALLGVWLGVVAHRLVPERLFFAITYVLLSVTGSKLIWDALT